MFYNFNKNLRFLRKKSGFTVLQLSELVGVAKGTIDMIECDKRNVSIELLDKFHSIFSVSLDDLVYKDLEKGE